jgi:hypothetical protein
MFLSISSNGFFCRQFADGEAEFPRYQRQITGAYKRTDSTDKLFLISDFVHKVDPIDLLSRVIAILLEF